jgi:hypothetical protein
MPPVAPPRAWFGQPRVATTPSVTSQQSSRVVRVVENEWLPATVLLARLHRQLHRFPRLCVAAAPSRGWRKIWFPRHGEWGLLARFVDSFFILNTETERGPRLATGDLPMAAPSGNDRGTSLGWRSKCLGTTVRRDHLFGCFSWSVGTRRHSGPAGHWHSSAVAVAELSAHGPTSRRSRGEYSLAPTSQWPAALRRVTANLSPWPTVALVLLRVEKPRPDSRSTVEWRDTGRLNNGCLERPEPFTSTRYRGPIGPGTCGHSRPTHQYERLGAVGSSPRHGRARP